MRYVFGVEDLETNYPEIEPLCRAHYAEMAARLKRDGINVSPYNPRLDRYFASCKAGHLIHYTARTDGECVGYANVYLTNDMHNGDLIAHEDLIYVTPEHRNGLGRKLVKFIIDDMRARGVKRGFVSPVTDLRVAKIWQRMGFKEVATIMCWDYSQE